MQLLQTQSVSHIRLLKSSPISLMETRRACTQSFVPTSLNDVPRHCFSFVHYSAHVSSFQSLTTPRHWWMTLESHQHPHQSNSERSDISLCLEMTTNTSNREKSSISRSEIWSLPYLFHYKNVIPLNLTSTTTEARMLQNDTIVDMEDRRGLISSYSF